MSTTCCADAIRLVNEKQVAIAADARARFIGAFLYPGGGTGAGKVRPGGEGRATSLARVGIGGQTMQLDQREPQRRATAIVAYHYTIVALGVTGSFSVILAVQAWRSRRVAS